MRFCGQCGTALARQCPQCHAEAPPGFRFCGQCGASLQAPPPQAAPAPTPRAPAAAPSIATYTPKHLADKILKSRAAVEGERRQVTVLFADVAGFTALAERLDPEDVHRIINRCFELITAEVHRFEGTINQYTGDGVMALFGAPIAHEDSPRRAAHAALGIQGAVRDYGKQLQAERGVTVQMRIGLNTGLVVVGSIGDDLRMDYTAVGDTTNLAARMQTAARPGSVLVTEATHNAIQGYFETLDLGELPVKGHSPVRAFEVLRTRGRRSRLDVAAERGLTPLVGRERELETLLDRFAEVKNGRGQMVSLVGDAGIGKSRLLLEFRRALAEAGEDVTWLEGQCVSFGQSIPFLPLAEQLRRNFGIEEFDGEPEIIAKVEHGMRRMGELEPHTPYIRYLLSVDPGDPAIAAMDALARRRKVFDAVRALTLRGAARHPIVFVFEDLHWVDHSSEEYLTALMDWVVSARIMLLMTYRVGYTPPFGTRSFLTTLTLQNLTERDALVMASRVLGTDRFPEELRAALVAKAEGVPLFVEEVTKTLLDLGVIQRDNGSYRIVRPIADAHVPDTIQGIIMARLDRLGEDGKRAVQLASVIGRQFLVRLLQRISGMTTEVDGLLRELKALEIVYEQGLLPEPAYVFKHAVIQDVAYNSLLVQRRKELHRAVGYAIEDLYADRLTEHYEELAHHFQHGEEWAKAFEYLARSGNRAKDAYANDTALDFFGRTLDVAARVVPPLPAQRLIQVHQHRGRVFMLLARYDDAISESERMRALAREAHDRRAEGEALADLAFAYWATFKTEHVPHVKRFAEEARVIAEETGDQHVLARSLTYLGSFDQIGGHLFDADAKFEESLRICEAAGFRDHMPQNFVWLGANANWRGEWAKSIETSRRGVAVAVEVHDGLSELFSLSFACLSHIALGDYAEALAKLHDTLRKARDRNNAFFQGRLINTLGWLYQELGDFRRAHEHNRESLDMAARINNSNVEISAAINIGLDYLAFGEATRAVGHLEETLTRIEKFGYGAHRWRWTIHATAYLAEALLAARNPAAAQVQAERALAQAHATGSMKYVGKCHALLGDIALAERHPNRAIEEFGRALDVARRLEYPTLTWQAAHRLAAAEWDAGKREDAVTHAGLAAETIATITNRVPEPALRETFLNWAPVNEAQALLDRLRRG